MSSLENDKIKEALWEDFLELYDNSESFAELVMSVMHPFEQWINKEYGRYDDRVLIKIFEEVWNNDPDLFCADKRSAVEIYIMFKNSMKKLSVLHDKN